MGSRRFGVALSVRGTLTVPGQGCWLQWGAEEGWARAGRGRES